jgi:protein-arginine kinase activator protein McsA
MTTCEYCGRTLRVGETLQGIRYGTLAASGFKPACDCAEVIICESCGSRLSQYVYSSLDTCALPYPTIFKMVTELSSLMRNGYLLIHNIGKLPTTDQLALQHLITACKEAS